MVSPVSWILSGRVRTVEEGHPKRSTRSWFQKAQWAYFELSERTEVNKVVLSWECRTTPLNEFLSTTNVDWELATACSRESFGDCRRVGHGARPSLRR